MPAKNRAIKSSKIKDSLFTLVQYALPHHSLSRVMGVAAECRAHWWKNAFIRWFIKRYDVDMEEAENPHIDAYENFNHFFTRALKAGTRPKAESGKDIVSPADGVISQVGDIADGILLQAKGKTFTLSDLLGDESRAEAFRQGNYATIYLSPRDYHRVHMPAAGKLVEMVHVPGRLFSVNQATTAGVPNLFVRNERVIALFETEFGPMAVILVGAMLVASVETVWHGVVSPPTTPNIQTWAYPEQPPTLACGEEMGRFKMGSTVIVLFGNDQMNWQETLDSNSAVRMGETIGTTAYS